MQVSIKIVNLVIISLIYVSVIDCQPYPMRGNNLPIDDLVAAIATAAMNGVIPLHKMNLGNPNRKGDAPLRIPILLIRPNDLRSLKNGKKLSNDRPVWGNINRKGPRNGRDYQRDHYKKDYSPKPKYPTQGMKIIAAPKNLEYEKSALKKNFDKKPILQFNNNYRHNGRDREFEEFGDRYIENLNNGKGRNFNDKEMGQFNHRMNEERHNRNRLNKYRPIEEELPNDRDRGNDRYKEVHNERPVLKNDRWKVTGDNQQDTYELPEKDQERPIDEDDYEDEPLPQLKPVMKVPTIVRHVYGGNSPTEREKPTIPPRYLKSIAEIPSSSGSNPEKYDNSEDDRDDQLPPLKMQPNGERTYKTERMVTHKYLDLGDVYRKPNSEPEEYSDGQDDRGDQGGDQGNNDEGPLAGYGKDPYDKQLISTLTKLMATSKNRHPLNIGGLTGADENKQQKSKPESKTKYLTSSGGQSSSKSFDDLFGPPMKSSSYKLSTNNDNQQLLPQSQYSSSSSQIQSNTQSKIPESLLSSFTSLSSRDSGSQGSVNKDNLSTASNNNHNGLVPLPPSQVPVVTSQTRKPVFLPLDYSTNDRPISAGSYFDDAMDEYSPEKSSQA